MPELVVFLNKVDLLSKADEDLKELVEMEVRKVDVDVQLRDGAKGLVA